MARAHVDGLRTSDAMTLQVLAGDLLRYPLCRLDPRSLCDLLALSESDALPVQLTRDLHRFRKQMLREYNDIPDGEPLAEFLRDLQSVDADRIPRSLRTGILDREPDSLPVVHKLREALLAHFQSAEPAPVNVSGRSNIRVEHVRSTKVPRSAKEKEESLGGSSPVRRSGPKPKRLTDPERFEWVREDLLARLAAYPEQGLKQAMLVAGARHRSPWNDLKEQEIVSVLRALAAADRIRASAGRWRLVTRYR